MTRVTKRNFGDSLKHAIEASDAKEKNLKSILDIINDVKIDIENFTQSKVSIGLRDSQKHILLKAATYYSTFDKTNPLLGKPTNQVMFFLLTTENPKVEDLTVLEFGSEGFPCTIYVDGNRLTSADSESFEENLDTLFSSPSTGEKLKSLMGVNSESIESIDGKENDLSVLVDTPPISVSTTTRSG